MFFMFILSLSRNVFLDKERECMIIVVSEKRESAKKRKEKLIS